MTAERIIFQRRQKARLYLGGALETLNALPPKSVDLVFADPPYGLSNGGFSCHAGRRVCVDKGAWDKSPGVAEGFAFHEQWIAACRRVLKPNGSLWVSGTYHSIYACGYALQKGGWHILNDIAWFKPNAPPHLACRMFAASHESLIWARKNKSARHVFHYQEMRDGQWDGDSAKKEGKQMRSLWIIGTPKPAEKHHGKHPTQKPLALLERIVRACSNPGDVILDPFCGSATTGVAALGHGREFIGIDSDENYLRDIAMPRLRECLQKAPPKSRGTAAQDALMSQEL